MIKGPLTVVILGPRGAGISEFVDLLSTAIMARGELDMASHVHAPTFRIEDGEAEPIGPRDADILIKTISASPADIASLGGLWNDIRRRDNERR